VSSEAAGRLLGLAIHQPSAVSILEDLLVAGRGLQLTERGVSGPEVGGPPMIREGHLPVAIVRRGTHVGFDDPRFSRTEPGDIVVTINSESNPP
jgi:voltage-gated potassium channel